MKLTIDNRTILNTIPLFRGKSLAITQFTQGLMNMTYRVDDGRHAYVARFAPTNSHLLGPRREREIHNTRVAAAQDIGPSVIRHYPRHRLLITKFIPGEISTQKTLRLPRHIRAAARRLKKLHAGKKFLGMFDPFATIRKHIVLAKKYGVQMPKNIQTLCEELREIESLLGPLTLTTPCHLDLMVENIVLQKNAVKFIDWEYSANSDYRYDLAMLSVKGGFTDRDDDLLLRTYGRADAATRQSVHLLKAVVGFREAVWGLLQIALSNIPYDYKKYAWENFELFRLYKKRAL
ncbi:MAG: choline/ethanolamine kinase family protein [Patescibacteria group bacterium]